MMRSQIIREVETELIQTRARALLKHPGETLHEALTRQALRRRQMKQAMAVLLAVGFIVALWVL